MKKYFVPFLLLLLCVGLFGTFLLWDTIKTELTIRDTFQNWPKVKAHFDQIFVDISSITKDTLLEEEKSELDFDRFYPECLRGNGQQIYGADRSYEEVLLEYDQALTDKGWANWLYERNPPPAAVTVETPTYSNPGWTVDVTIIRRDDLNTTHPEWGRYQTIYYIEFVFAEPSVFTCYG